MDSSHYRGWGKGGGVFNCTEKEAHGRVRRPVSLMVRLYVIKDVVKEYEKAFSSMTSSFEQPLQLSRTICPGIRAKSGSQTPSPLKVGRGFYRIIASWHHAGRKIEDSKIHHLAREIAEKYPPFKYQEMRPWS